MDRHIEELLPFYVLDALTEEEREQVEAYLASHQEARVEVEEMIRAASALPQSVSPVTPASQTKEALMKRVAADSKTRTDRSEQSQPSPRASRFESLFRIFSLAAAGIAIILVIALSAQVTALKDEIASVNSALTKQANAFNQIIQTLPQSTPSNTITVSLKGTNAEPKAQGQLIANPTSQSAVLVISGLPPLEPGKTYQVWLIGDPPISAGLLTTDAEGQGVLIITSQQPIGSFKSLGISVEPEGGSEQPTGDIVVLSDL
jgi:anti-sigma-K factor RskA